MRDKIKKAKNDRKWQKQNKDKVSLISKRHRNKDPQVTKEKLAARKLKFLYGLTQDQYNTMLLKQNGCCKICNVSQDSLTKKLSVDHCHETNKIRGLLCPNCNRALGLLGDSIKNLQTAVDYLLENQVQRACDLKDKN